MKRLFSLYKRFLQFPFENITLYAKNRPLTLKETHQNIQNGLGGDCVALSKYIQKRLANKEIPSKIIHFENDFPEVNKTIKVEKTIDEKYHSAVIAYNKIPYLLDVTLQFEEPIPLNKNGFFDFPSKFLKLTKNGNFFEVYRLDRGNKEIRLKFNIDDFWTREDHNRDARNNYFRDLPIKYARLEKGVKIAFKVKNSREGIIYGRTKNSIETIFEGDLEKCSGILGIDYKILEKAVHNWTELRMSQGILR